MEDWQGLPTDKPQDIRLRVCRLANEFALRPLDFGDIWCADSGPPFAVGCPVSSDSGAASLLAFPWCSRCDLCVLRTDPFPEVLPCLNSEGVNGLLCCYKWLQKNRHLIVCKVLFNDFPVELGYAKKPGCLAPCRRTANARRTFVLKKRSFEKL